MSQDKELTVDNTSVGIAGVGGENFTLFEGQEVAQWLDAAFENQAQAGGETMEVDS